MEGSCVVLCVGVWGVLVVGLCFLFLCVVVWWGVVWGGGLGCVVLCGVCCVV